MAGDGPKFVIQEHPHDGKLWTHSIVSAATKRGLVVIGWNGERGQFDPEDARVFAHTILRECDNAETDAFLYSHFKEFLNEMQLAVLISHYREYRARLEQNAGLRPTGQPIPEDDAR